jgi:hypothetical protein
MMNIKRDYRFAGGDFGANGFNINTLVLSDRSHRVGHNAHTGRLQLSHTSSAGIILIRLTGIFSAPRPYAWQHPDICHHFTKISPPNAIRYTRPIFHPLKAHKPCAIKRKAWFNMLTWKFNPISLI